MLAPSGSARATKGWGFSIFQNSHLLLVQFMAIHTILYQDHNLPNVGNVGITPWSLECAFLRSCWDMYTPNLANDFGRTEPQLPPHRGSEMPLFREKLASSFLSLVTKQLLTPRNPIWNSICYYIRCSRYIICFIAVKKCLLIQSAKNVCKLLNKLVGDMGHLDPAWRNVNQHSQPFKLYGSSTGFQN